MISKGDLYTTQAGNVFQVVWIKEEKVKLDRIGVLREGDYVPMLGIPAIVSSDWLQTASNFVPCVRCFGNVIIPLEQYLLKYDLI